MTETKPNATAEAAEFPRQLTSALLRKDQLQRRISTDQGELEQCDRNIVALQNLITGIELGKMVGAEKAASEKAE